MNDQIPTIVWSDYLVGDYDDAFDCLYQDQGQGDQNMVGYGQTGSALQLQQHSTEALSGQLLVQEEGPSHPSHKPLSSFVGEKFVTSPCNKVLPGKEPQATIPVHILTAEVIQGTEPVVETPISVSLSERLPKSRPVFSSFARSLVRGWLDSHVDDPYPTTEEKGDFAQRLNLSIAQVSTLFNNERQRYKKATPKPNDPTPFVSPPREQSSTFATLRGREKGKGSKNANSQVSGHAGSSSSVCGSETSPLERYLSSSSDEDPQPAHLVVEAAAKIKFRPAVPDEALQANKRRKLSGDGSGSELSSRSDASSQSSYTSGKRGRRKTTIVRETSSTKGRYYCTFCWKNFTTSGSWRKHETTIHKPQKEIECRMDDLRPSMENCGACLNSEKGCQKSLEHNYMACKNRTKEARTFYRSDHFLNHLDGIHDAAFTPIMENWWQPTENTGRSRCGYCCKWFPSWTERLDHIGLHYRLDEGFNKSLWKISNEDDASPESFTQPQQTSGVPGIPVSSLVRVQGRGEFDFKFEPNPLFQHMFTYKKQLSRNYQDFPDLGYLLLRRVRVHDGGGSESANCSGGVEETKAHGFARNLRPNFGPENSGSHHHDCDAVSGGTCKFDLLHIC